MRKTPGVSGGVRKKMPEGKKFFLASIPFLILVFAFAYVPLMGWAYAFFDYHPGMSLFDCDFVGLKTFAKIWANKEELFRVMRNTLALSFFSILGMPLAVIFAVMLNEIKSSKFRKLVQTTTTLPNFISWIVVFTLAFAMFSTDGMVAGVFRAIGVDKVVNFLGDNKHAWLFQWSLATWKCLGWSAIIYIATIAGIDSELYDAAHVDGANRMQTIRHITIPGLYSTFFVQMLLAISNMLSNGFEQYFVFYNPLTADKIEVLDYYVYKIGVLTNDYPQSIALGMAKTVISVILLFSANQLSKRVRGESIV
ncbi:MAG: ABC transporter permease subunit [Lachnospiraceae bacterium]|nr:ABC transporter permease subunit [Lachnospiraceae bacterium]